MVVLLLPQLLLPLLLHHGDEVHRVGDGVTVNGSSRPCRSILVFHKNLNIKERKDLNTVLRISRIKIVELIRMKPNDFMEDKIN